MADEQKTLIDITALKYFYKSLQNVTVLIAPSSIESASSQNLGRTYFIPADGTYAGLSCKKGDHIVSNGTAWVLIPKGTSEGGTTYYAGTGIDISKVSGKDTITNTGVTAIAEATGDANKGKISVTTNGTTANVAVHGLSSAAYETVGTEKTDITSAGTKVPNAKAVYGFVDDAIKALDVADTAESGKYVSAVSEADGKITVTRASLPTSLPASDVTDTYSATGKVPVSGTAVASAISGKLDANQKGAKSGVAELDANGKVLSSQLPSYVDDVVEASSKSAFPTTGESGKIYVDTTANLTYRWTGTAYTEISPSIALGETSSTAYRGDRGKTAYDHATTTATNPHGTTKSDVGLGNVGNFKAVSTVASQGLTDTEKSNARTNIGAGTYSKASTGIPKTDLASAVQTSLGLADTALQSYTEKYTGTVTKVKVGSSGTEYSPSSGVVTIPAYPTSLPASNTTDTYSSTGTVPVSGKAVASAIGGLDVTGTTSFGAGKTISAWSETDGKISITSQNISITKSQVSDFPTSMTPTAHNQASNTITAMTGYSKGTNTGAIAVTDSLNTAIAKLENDKADKTELLSTVGTVYERYGCKSLWSIDEKIMTAAGYIQNGYINSAYKTKLQPGKYKLTIKSSVAATMQLNLVLYSDPSKKTTVTFNAVVGANVVDITNLYEADFMQLYTQKAGTYSEIAIITEDTPAEPYVPYAPTNRELQTNLLSTIIASSNASSTNTKTLDFKGTGKALEKLVIEGKTSQDGTPSPSTPVDVKGVGDKCNNIFDYTKWANTWSAVQSGTVSKDASGFTLTATANDCYTKTYNVIECLISGYKVGRTYTLSWKANVSIGGNVFIFDNVGNVIKNGNNSSTKSITFTATTTSIQIRFGVAASGASIRYYDIKIEEGSTATKYYPYDKLNMYEIPISCGGKSSNIYLNAPLFNAEILDTETGTANKKWGIIVLDGTQNGASMASGRNHAVYGIVISNMKAGSRGNGYCDRFVPANSWDQEGTLVFGTSGNNLYVTFPDSLGISTIEQAKTWFGANPTTIVYPLATDTKESFEAPEISTVVGKNTLTIGTDITPTKVEVTSFGEYYSKAQIDKMFAEIKAMIPSATALSEDSED